MDVTIRNILSQEYNFNVDSLSVLEGGYNLDDTYLIVTNDHSKYVVKCIQYCLGVDHLRSILYFQNLLHHSYDYPCSRIVLSNDQRLVLPVENRFLFVQTFLEGLEPTRQTLDNDHSYLHEMGRLLGRWRIASRHYTSSCLHMEQDREFTDKWWKEKQVVDDTDPVLLTNFMLCRQILVELDKNLEHGLIHNDFHPNNTLTNSDGKIFVID